VHDAAVPLAGANGLVMAARTVETSSATARASVTTALAIVFPNTTPDSHMGGVSFDTVLRAAIAANGK
jgi:hypothetical protein